MFEIWLTGGFVCLVWLVVFLLLLFNIYLRHMGFLPFHKYLNQIFLILTLSLGKCALFFWFLSWINVYLWCLLWLYSLELFPAQRVYLSDKFCSNRITSWSFLIFLLITKQIDELSHVLFSSQILNSTTNSKFWDVNSLRSVGFWLLKSIMNLSQTLPLTFY